MLKSCTAKSAAMLDIEILSIEKIWHLNHLKLKRESELMTLKSIRIIPPFPTSFTTIYVYVKSHNQQIHQGNFQSFFSWETEECTFCVQIQHS